MSDIQRGDAGPTNHVFVQLISALEPTGIPPLTPE